MSSSETQIEGFSAKILLGSEDKHSELLHSCVNDRDIFNIALSGPYGSGKTSIIKTFKNKFALSYIDISLATFDDKFTTEGSTSKLEYCILKQLFYKVHPEKVPESRFKRIVNHQYVGVNAFIFFCWLISILYFANNKILISLAKALGVDFYSSVLNGIYGCIAIIGLIFIVYKGYDFLINFKMTKFKFSDAEVESKHEKATLNFENEIDEILYFFERNPIDVVFFEDLDRFHNTEIFIKLREINFLINNYDPIKEKGKVTFVYAVVDDIFTQTERTKFFDFIVPVVPVINYTNSAKELIDRFKVEINSIEDLKGQRVFKSFIEKISLYLTDMRIIISIANEYTVYKKILNENIDQKKLFAMMVYKNLEPTDFDLLDRREGYVYSLLKNKKIFIETSLEEIQKRLTQTNGQIVAAREEQLMSLNEIKSVYIAKFIQIVNERHGNGVSHIVLNGVSLKFLDLLSDENFKAFTEITTTTYYYYPGNSKNITMRFSEIEKLVNPKISYLERIEKINNTATKRDNELRSKSQAFENQIKDLNSKRLSELLNEFDSNDYFEKRKESYENFLKKNKKPKAEQVVYNYDLINYFAKSGYIDEDFEHYISRQDGNLSKEDRDFLLSFNSKALPFDIKLKELNSLISKIDETYFYKNEILNFSLLDYLLENGRNLDIDKILTVLSQESETTMKFVDEYLSYASEENKNSFFIKITNSWSNIFNFISNKTNFTFDKKSFYVRKIFTLQSLQKIKELNREKSIIYFLTNSETLSPIFFEDNNKTKVMDFIKGERTYFENLVYEEQHYDLLKFIYENNLYEINLSMIRLMIQTFKANDVDLDKLESSNYSVIQDSGCKSMCQYIDYEIEYYLDKVLFRLEGNENESEKNILHIINDLVVPEETASRIIKKNRTLISTLADIKDKNLWKEFFDAKKLNISWNNVITYFKEHKEIDTILIEYLNEEDVFEALSISVITESDTDIEIDFVTKLILCGVSIESFKKLVKIIRYKYSYDEVNELEERRILILIQNQIIEFSVTNFNEINSDHEDPAIHLSEMHKQDFFDNIDELELTSTNISSLLNSSFFTDPERINILKAVDENIIINSRKTASEVCSFLLRQPLIPITEKLINSLLESDVPSNERVLFFNKYYSSSLSLIVLNDRLRSLGKPFVDLVDTRETIDLKDTEENNIFYSLVNKRIVGKKTEKNGYIKIWQLVNKK